MSCSLHRECPTGCPNWTPCLEPCDHETCSEALGFAAWLGNQNIGGREHVPIENFFA